MLRQKARIKCDVEGNEHSKFFHSFVKRRNNKNNIRGLMVNRIWSEDPKVIKMEMARYYKALFIEGMTIRPLFCYDRIGKFSDDEAAMLEKGFLEKEGFGAKWCKWVESCLRSSTMSILVNESPTKEFSLERGVRQGDPLSPFLFILAAEGLDVIVNEAVQNGVNDREIGDMARWMRCGVGEFPFTYLGMPIGENMRRVNAWDPIVEKFKKRLADWKTKTMSFGGRLTLVESDLGSLLLYYFSMFRGVRGKLNRRGVWREIIKIGEELRELA
ncbi:reverse transcriptase domain, reverse transcriptase zinc-binding domain protein [Tanacetum coccineum]